MKKVEGEVKGGRRRLTERSYRGREEGRERGKERMEESENGALFREGS